MRKIILTSILVGLAFSSCRKRLDDFLFNPNNDITEYKLDDYTGEGDIEIGAEYKIHDSLIHLFTLPMKLDDEDFTIHAIYTGDLSKIATDSVIMYCHGNAGNMDYYWARQKLLANLGGKTNFGVLQIDYPGYGLSTGKTSEENMYASVGKALDWLKEKGLTNDRLIMYGFSLGSAPVCEITSKGNYALQASKIILEAPFASAETMIQDASILNMPGSYFVNLKIDNAEEIKSVLQPLLWLHGIDDDFLNIETHGEIVFKNYSGTYGEPIRVPVAGHSTVPNTMGYVNYSNSILNFIRK